MKRKIEQRVKGSRAVRGGTEHALEIAVAGAKERIPGILLVPAGATRASPAAAALLLHGYASRKEHLSESVGCTLMEHGIASLAIDLPLHGEREDPLQAQAMRNPLELRRRWKDGLEECELALRYLGVRDEIDGERLAIIGYSLGSFVAVAVAARESVVRAVVLAAGGDLPNGTPLTAVARLVADPLKAVRRLEGRPLLMVHGKGDQTVRPEQAKRLFEAARDPKEIRWWDAGHRLPPEAMHDAAEWLARQLGARAAENATKKRARASLRSR